MSDSVSFEWDFSEIMNEIEKMGVDVKKVESRATKRGAKVVKAAVEKNIGRSDIDKDGYVHMQDDVKISALKEDKGILDSIRTVGGGKKTGWKWAVREYGQSNREADRFVTKSYEETKEEVKNIINEELKKELNL